LPKTRTVCIPLSMVAGIAPPLRNWSIMLAKSGFRCLYHSGNRSWNSRVTSSSSTPRAVAAARYFSPSAATRVKSSGQSFAFPSHPKKFLPSSQHLTIHPPPHRAPHAASSTGRRCFSRTPLMRPVAMTTNEARRFMAACRHFPMEAIRYKRDPSRRATLPLAFTTNEATDSRATSRHAFNRITQIRGIPAPPMQLPEVFLRTKPLIREPHHGMPPNRINQIQARTKPESHSSPRRYYERSHWFTSHITGCLQ
jgi:hypothetical protein